MTNVVTANLYEYKKEHPLGDILLFDGHIDVIQMAHVIEIRQALAFVLKGGLGKAVGLNNPMVMLRTQGDKSGKRGEENSAVLRARWASDTLDEFGSDLDGKVLIHTGYSCSDEDFIIDISRDVSMIVRVVTDSSVVEAILHDGKLHIPAQSSLGKEDIHRLCMGESVDGAEQHLATDVIKSLALESIVAIQNITGSRSREEVLGLVNHAIANTLVGNTLMLVLREICRNNRQDLLPDLMAIAKSTTDIGIQLEMLKCCSKLYPSSFSESYVDSEVDIPLDDEYSRRYLEEFKNAGGDSFSRKGKSGIPCSASEEIFVNQINTGRIAFLLEDRPGKPKSVWIFKEGDCGHIDSEYDVLLNLATLELYEPNPALRDCLSGLNRAKPGQAIRMQDLDDNIDKEISFYRLGYCVNANVGSHDGKKLMRFRKEILGKYVPLG